MIKNILRLNEWVLCTPSHIFVGSALGKFANFFFFLFLFALDHIEYCVNQCIIYLACIGIGMLFLCLQHVRRVWGQRLKNVEFSKDTWMVHCISLKKCVRMKKALHYRIWKDSHLKGFLETQIKSWGTNVFAYILAASLQKPNFRYCCLTNVQHWRLVFQAHLWAFTAAFQTLIFVRPFSLWKKKKNLSRLSKIL